MWFKERGHSRERSSESPHRVEQSGVQHGSVCVPDEVKLEKEAKHSSEMANQRENVAQSGQMKAKGVGMEQPLGPFGAHFQKNLVK